MPKLPFYPMAVMLLIGTGGYLGCDPNSIQVPQGTSETASNVPQFTASIPDRTDATILLGSFNIQKFGPSKLANAAVMDKLAAIVQKFDVVAIQEITSKNQPAAQILVDRINAQGQQYAHTISPRIGRPHLGYYEQYAFVYDTRKVRSGAQFSYVVQDQADLLHREPFVGRFQTVVSNTQPFQFTLINVHTDPDEIGEELNVLADVYNEIRKFEYPEDDVILLGDLNAAPEKMQRLATIPAVRPLLVGIATNTRKNRALDNILADSQTTREFTGRVGTIDLEQMFAVSLDEAEDISDHLPIWAEFSIGEQAVTSTALSGRATTLR